ncbi:MAG: adenylate/guanylate cyclase domain-containing protein [Rothia sp. (in: high G+C Gram-positive bacteria)]|nr:adenylate/guanylate cyclase domain-containing protein [Rothia sp. (in: high G+C Gram-positive bacteria)]
MESAPTGSSHQTPEEPGHERLQYLQNREQSNVYRTPEARAAVREFEKVLLGSNRQMRRREAAEQADVSLLTARKVWRALGFPNIDDDEVFFTPSDCEALATIVGLNRSHELEEESTISITRSVGQLTDRMVAWQIETLVEDIVKTKGYTDSQARQELLTLLPELIEELEAILLYGYRRQLSAAVLRLALRSDQNDANDPSLLPLVRGVGFADLVSYTSLSRRMNEKNLTELVKTFEQRCAEVVAAGGGRIIKTIGDEVMFLTETPEAAAQISMALSKEIQSDPHLPDARVAFVWGRILPKLGDIYGPSVNLASRLVAVADPGVVVTDKITADTLENDPRFVLTPQRVRDIRGFGEIWPVALTPGIGNELEIDF